MAIAVQLGLPLRLNHCRCRGLTNNGRAGNALARLELRAPEYRRVPPSAVHIRPDLLQRLRGLALSRRQLGVVNGLRCADRFDRDRLGDQLSCCDDKAKALLVGGLKRGPHATEVSQVHLESGVSPLVAQMDPFVQAESIGRHPLRQNLVAGLVAEFRAGRFQYGYGGGRERLFDLTLAQRPHVCQTHPIGRQHPGKGMQKDGLHAQRVRDQTGVLAGGPTKAVQGIFRHIVAALDGDFLDGIRHIFYGDAQKAGGYSLRRLDRIVRSAGNFCGQGHKLVSNDVHVQSLIRVRAKHRGKEGCLQLAQHDVAVGHGEWAAALIARRPGVCTGRVRANPKTGAIKIQDRPSARRDGVDMHHRGAHADASDQGFKCPLIFAVIVRHIGRGAAHIEADNFAETRHRRGPDHADHPTGRSG